MQQPRMEILQITRQDAAFTQNNALLDTTAAATLSSALQRTQGTLLLLSTLPFSIIVIFFRAFGSRHHFFFSREKLQKGSCQEACKELQEPTPTEVLASTELMRMELTREMLLRSQCRAVGSWLPLPTASPNPEHLPGFNSGQSEMRKCRVFLLLRIAFSGNKTAHAPKAQGLPVQGALGAFFCTAAASQSAGCNFSVPSPRPC